MCLLARRNQAIKMREEWTGTFAIRIETSQNYLPDTDVAASYYGSTYSRKSQMDRNMPDTILTSV